MFGIDAGTSSAACRRAPAILGLCLWLCASCADTAPDDDVGEIAAAQSYLQQFGYLPSEAMRKERSGIEFIVDRPFQAGALDEPTAEALRQYQGRFGLTVTGRYDTATRDAMNQPRCGHPDALVRDPTLEDAPGHEHDKFALQSKKTRGTATVRVVKYPSGVSTALVDRGIEAVTKEFRNRSGMVFTPTTSTSIPSGVWQIEVWFYSGAGPSNRPSDCPDWNTLPTILAQSNPLFFTDTGEAVGNSIRLCFNTGQPYAYDAWESGKFHFRTVLLHELGHLAGLGHSSIEGAVMRPKIGSGQLNETLRKDDLHALWVRWGQWAEMQGSSATVDLALNPKNNDELWTVLENGAIYRRTASYRNQTGSVSGTWTRVDGIATRIAHDGVRPWVVNGAGQVFWRNDQGTAWNLAPGCGRDVTGNAARGEYVIAGCDGSIYKLVGSEAQKIGRPSFGAATRVSVSHTVSAIGVVDDSGKGYLNNLASPIPGALVNDFSFGSDGTLWAITLDSRPAIFNVQPELPGGVNGAPARNKFEAYPGGAFAITGNSRGEPTISNGAKRISDIRLFYTN